MNDESIFHEALARRTPAERAAYLDHACAGDPELRASVEALLRANDGVTGFLERTPPVVAPPPESPGTCIGPYQLLQPLGEGGMGTVWMAQQQKPVQRLVALKLIKPGMDSKQVVARFEQERQALALMDHANIARVLDAGTTGGEPGRPYFVMEMVKGVPITDYCDMQQLMPRQRLELFVSVCQAVQHAHQKGIIHRDLKPSNVLVALYDARAVPKVIDFGVAKATGPRLTEQTVCTEAGSVVGTLEYMSPEQAELDQLDIDTRSDVYSLGVLLYELLTGSTPLERKRLRGVSLLEALRLIREEEPPRPSARLETAEDLSAIAARRGLEPARLSGVVRGELDWIVMKCLEKERDRRYDTAAALARDCERYLNDEPVQACPPSALYRVGKFVRRHKRALATAGLLGIMLLAGVSYVAWTVRDRKAQARDAAHQRESRKALLTQEITRSLADVERSYGADRLPEALASSKQAEGLLVGAEVDDELRDRVLRWRRDLEIVARIEEIRLDQDDPGGALRVFEVESEKDQAYRAVFVAYGLDVETLPVDEAAERVRGSAVRERLLAALDSWSLARAGSDPAGRDRLIAVARRSDDDPYRDRIRAALLRRDVDALTAMAREPELMRQPRTTLLLLGEVLIDLRQSAAAEPALREAQRQAPGDFDGNIKLMSALAGRGAQEAIPFVRAALAVRPDNVRLRVILAVKLQFMNRPAESEAEWREVLRRKPDMDLAHERLREVMVQQGKADQVLASYPQAVQANPDDPVARHNLGQHLLGQLRYAEAEEEFRQALRLRPDYLAARDGLGKALARQGRHREAEAEYRRYLAQRKDATGRVGLRMALESQSRWPEVEAVLRETIRLHQNDSSSYRNLARALIKQDKLVEARGAFQQSIRLSARSRGGTTEAELGEVHARLGEWPEALAACTTSIDDLPTFPAHVNAAALYLHAGDRDGYRRVVARLLDRYGQGYARTSCEQTVLACLLLPGEVSGDRLARAADRLVVTGGIFDRMTAKSLVARALFDCRAKRYDEAAARLSKASAGESDPPLEATAAAVRTLIEAGRGDRGKAALALEQARGVLQLVPDPARGRPFGPDWLDWLQARILVAEAEGAVAGKDRAPPP